MKREPINRENYEEYFLLYVDNELSAVERSEVEAFTQMHADLRVELTMLLDTRLVPEDLKMEGVEELFRNDGNLHEGNLEEWQLLAIDGELDAESRKMLDNYQQQRPDALNNFDQLHLTKLPIEEIIFPDKGLLYRTENKPAAIRAMPWLRVSAAASVIFLVGGLWFFMSQEPTTQVAQTRPEQRAENSDKVQGLELRVEDSNRAAGLALEDQDPDRLQGLGLGVEEVTNGIAQTKKRTGSNERKAMESGNGSEKKLTPIAPTSNAPAPLYARVAALPGPDKDAFRSGDNKDAFRSGDSKLVARTGENRDIINSGYPKEIPTPEVHATNAVAMNVKADYAADALSGVMEESTEVDEDARSRKGFRGIIRKANRLYNKVTNPELDRQMVKVAGFEVGLPR